MSQDESSSNSQLSDKLPPGLTVGHADDPQGLTGCTAILFDRAVIGASDIGGSAPATSNFSAVNPVHAYPRIDAVFLTGGSVFGLNAVGGVQRFLEEKQRGFNVGVTTIPIVPTAGIFDLAVGDPNARPTAEMAYQACLNASSSLPQQGSVGAGMGASVGKFFGIQQAMRGGFGTSRAVTKSGAEVLAFAVVNAFGDIWCHGTNSILAGARTTSSSLSFADANAHIAQGWRRTGFGGNASVQKVERVSEHEWTKQQQETSSSDLPSPGNTTLIVLVTTAQLDVLDAKKLAQSSMFGLVDVVRPACTIFDGDLCIAASIGDHKEDLTEICVLSRQVVAEAIVSGVKQSASAGNLPAWGALKS